MKNNIKLDIVHRVSALTNSKEDLWMEVAKLSRTLPHIEADFAGKLKMELELLRGVFQDDQKTLAEIQELKSLVFSALQTI
ncbi:MAG: hypothetical protein RBT37_01390 [Dissulfurispiraceae bacterium]|jgi:hypothetical protein|nr:hypothetical protein [Dissulfurispiraceae bacterium]